MGSCMLKIMADPFCPIAEDQIQLNYHVRREKIFFPFTDKKAYSLNK